MKFLLLVTGLLAELTQDPSARLRRRLEEGRRHYQEQEYALALPPLRAVASDPAATRAQKAAALEVLGLSYLILGRRDRAREAFENLLAIDPDATLADPSLSPKLRRFFEEVKAAFVPGYRPGAPTVALEHAAPQGALAGRPLEMATAAVERAPCDRDRASESSCVREVVVRWRRRGLLEYASAPLSRQSEGGRFRGYLHPPADVSSYTIEYYVEARDLGGRVVGRAGGPEQPLSIEVRGGRALSPAWYRRWWVWSLVGVSAAGATAAVLSATRSTAPAGTLPPGRIVLDLTAREGVSLELR
jgi:tetratricopeptide (TPR) repeat protein